MKETITLFTRDNCPYCVRAKNALDKFHVPYRVVNITEQEKRNRFYDDCGFKGNERTMPKMVVEAGGQRIMIRDSNEIINFAEDYQNI